MAHSATFKGGSTAGRTINCPGWRKLAMDLDLPNKSSDAADEGSMLHACAEKYLLNGTEPEDMVGFQAFGKVLTKELCREKLRPAIDAFEEFVNTETSGNIDYEVEAEVIIPGTDDAFGTADIVLIDRGWRRLWIMDWKFGYWPVSAEENDQLAYYANGYLACYVPTEEEPEPLENIGLVVLQGGNYSAWHTDHEWLHSRLVSFLNALDRDELSIGDHCKFCPAKETNTCPEHHFLAKGALEDYQTDTYRRELGYWMSKVGQLEEFCKAVRGAAEATMEAGGQVPGYKLVAKRATRKWIDPTKTEEHLRKIVRRKSNDLHVGDVFTTTLKSPAQIEKTLKAASVDPGELKGYIESLSSGTTVAEESDKRPEIPGLAGLENLGHLSGV